MEQEDISLLEGSKVRNAGVKGKKFSVYDGLKPASDDNGSSSHTEVKVGLTVTTACFFIYGELAGIGLFGLSAAMEKTGYTGAIIIAVCCAVSCYTGHLLGQSWIMVQSRYKEYRGHVRHPYPTVGEITFGTFGRISVSVSANFSMLGSCVVILVFASQNIHRFFSSAFDIEFPFCILMIILAACLTPFSWFGTPKDFWVVALGASVSTSLAVLLAWIVMALDYASQETPTVLHTPDDALGFFQGVGTMLLACGGHFAFLTFQNDMAKPAVFKICLSLAYAGLAAIYIPTAAFGYTVYGSSVNANILLSLGPGVISNIVLLLVTCHLLCAFIIVSNPCMQHLEEVLQVNKAFSRQRVLLRSLVVIGLLFVAETVPNFGAIVSLLGGSTYTFTMLIAPTAIYYKLCTMKGDWEPVHIPLHTKVLLLEIFVMGCVIGVIATYGSFRALWGSSDFTVPCYVDMAAAGSK